MRIDEVKIEDIVVIFLSEYAFVKCFFENKLTKGQFSFAFYVYKEKSPNVIDKTIHKSEYTDRDFWKFEAHEPGFYKVKVFIKDNQTNKVISKMSESLIKE